jgi:hypothetical protein
VAPTFDVELIDQDGITSASWSVTLAPDATAVIDVRDECVRRDVPLPFEGQLLLRVADELLVPGRPVQVFVEYVDDGGEVTGVHGQYGLMSFPLAQTIGGCRVDPSSGTRSGIVVVNPYDGPGAPVAMRSTLEVLASSGASRQVRLPAIPPRGTRRVYLDDAIPGLAGLLDGHPGQVRVRVPCPSSRALTFVEDAADGRLVVNHATIDRSFDQRPGRRPRWTEASPSFSLPVIVGPNRDTVLTLPNVWGPVVARRVVAISIHGGDGATLATGQVAVEAHGTADVSIRDLLRSRGIDGALVAHAEAWLVDEDPSTERPAILDVVVGIRDDGALAGEVQVGSDFFNAAVPDGIGVPDVRRTRIFSRVRCGPGERPVILLAHPVSPGGDDTSSARPTLRLLDTTGRVRSEVEPVIAPHGFVAGTVDELFGVQGLDRAVVRVRDTEHKLYGYHLVDIDGARSVPIDHFVGG